MSVYRAPDVADQPQVNLEQWRIFLVPEGEFHLCGVIAEYGSFDGRVSSKIVKFDPDTLTAVTRSGRVYKLVGETGWHKHAEYVRDVWLKFNGIDRDKVRFVLPDEVTVARLS